MEKKGITLPILVALVAVAAGAGYYAGNAAPLEEKIAAEGLPVLAEILRNPVYYEWWASVEGTVVEKTENSVTLEKDGKRAVIKVQADGELTRFYRAVSPQESPSEVSFEEVQVGSVLRGGVNVARRGTTGLAGEENVAFGTSFIIVE